ncbi:MAG: hypothetical protein NC418_06285 [Muribaculaceae bacterium]|nr:hypothetical protein [Muribaculaceae bacterium]
MKKIMFNDRYGLTEAVLSGRKTQTRRIVPRIFFTYTHDFDGDRLVCEDAWGDWHDIRETRFAYRVGEVVAVAQSYKDAGVKDVPSPIECIFYEAHHLKGWSNKMLVRADLMPHQIRITNVRVERLQDISDEDCIREGIVEACVNNNWGNCASHWEYNVPYEDDLGRAKLLRGLTPQETYAALIDRISGNGTWDSNPYVFVYDFELIKCGNI